MIWLTADTHLGDEKVAGRRGFASVEEHDATVLSNWRSRIAPADDVWVLGDVAARNWSQNVERLAKLPGRKHLILGNHDPAHPGHGNSHLRLAGCFLVFDSVTSAGEIRLNGRRVMLSHFPYDPDETDPPRLDQWRLRDLGMPLAHGHTHSDRQGSVSRAGSAQVCVGLEAWGMFPAPAGEVLRALDRVSVPAWQPQLVTA